MQADMWMRNMQTLLYYSHNWECCADLLQVFSLRVFSSLQCVLVMDLLAECWFPVTTVVCVNACRSGSNWHFSATKLLWKVETRRPVEGRIAQQCHTLLCLNKQGHTGPTVRACVCVRVCVIVFVRFCLQDSFLTGRSIHSYMFVFSHRKQCEKFQLFLWRRPTSFEVTHPRFCL